MISPIPDNLMKIPAFQKAQERESIHWHLHEERHNKQEGHSFQFAPFLIVVWPSFIQSNKHVVLVICDKLPAFYLINVFSRTHPSLFCIRLCKHLPTPSLYLAQSAALWQLLHVPPSPTQHQAYACERAEPMSQSGHHVFQLSWFWSFQTGVFPK